MCIVLLPLLRCGSESEPAQNHNCRDKILRRAAVWIGPYRQTDRQTDTEEDYRGLRGILDELMIVCKLSKVLKQWFRHVDMIYKTLGLK